MIDLFLANNKALFLDVQAVPSVSMDADHRLVMAIVRIKKPEYTGRVGSKRYKLAKFNDLEQVGRLKGPIEVKSVKHDGREENVEALWRQFKEKITEAADEILGEKKPYQGRTKMTSWWSEEVREIVKLKMINSRQWMKARTAEDRLQYKTVRNKAERAKRRAKETYWRRIGADVENDLHGTKMLLYSLAKSYRGKNSEGTCAIKDKGNNLLTQHKVISARWGEYFNELLNVGNGLERFDECVLSSEGMPVEQEDLIIIDEVRHAIK